MGEWPRKRIEDVALRIGMGPFGSSIKVDTFVAAGVPVISGEHLRNTRLEEQRFNFVTIQHADKLKNSNVFKGDVIFTHAGSIGQCAVIPAKSQHSRYILSQRQFYLRCDTNQVLPEFVTYFFKSHQGQHLLLANASQTGVPSIARPSSYLKTIQIPVPPLAEQREIANILGALDDKIELNRRMNATLVAMARALFQSWFVDFDPVRAKAEGRQPAGMNAETAALFPDTFEDSVLGPIPKGWEIRPLDDIAHFLNGLALQKFPVSGSSSLPVIKIAQLKNGHDTKRADRCSDKIPQDYVVRDGDVLFSWSGSLEVEVWTGGDGALNQHLFKISSQIYPKWFYYLWTLSHLEHFRSIAAGKATTMGHIQRKHLSDAKVLVPPSTLLLKMSENLSPLVASNTARKLQSKDLERLRDALLPKLLSGELRVGEVAV